MFNTFNKNILLIDKSVNFEGSINSNNHIFLLGKVKGTITSAKNIYVLKSAKVESSLVASNIQIFGVVEGDVSASNKVLISEEGRVFGNVKCQSLKLLEGALYSGELSIDKTS
jgi:cytoskeletal protein CcmA (bactofilin family)